MTPFPCKPRPRAVGSLRVVRADGHMDAVRGAVRTPRWAWWETLSTDQKAVNRTHAKIRALVEQAWHIVVAGGFGRSRQPGTEQSRIRPSTVPTTSRCCSARYAAETGVTGWPCARRVWRARTSPVAVSRVSTSPVRYTT